MFEIGTSLRDARLHRRIDLVEAEQDTKIRSKYLAALESEEFDVLPGPVFVRGFLRTYTRYLGLDQQLFIDEYNSRFGRFEEVDDHPVLGRPGLAHERGRRRVSAMRAAIVVSIIVLLALGWIGLRDSTSSTTSRPDAGRVEVDGGLSEAAAAAQVLALERSRPETTPDPTTERAPKVARLGVAAVGAAAWIEVRSGGPDGNVLFSGELPAGDRRSFRAARLHVVTGAPTATVLTLGDRRTRGEGTGPESFIVTPTRISSAQ